MVHRASGRSNGEQRYEEADLCRCAGAVYNANAKKSVAGIFDLSGRRVKLGSQHGVYIIRTAEGKTAKISK